MRSWLSRSGRELTDEGRASLIVKAAQGYEAGRESVSSEGVLKFREAVKNLRATDYGTKRMGQDALLKLKSDTSLTSLGGRPIDGSGVSLSSGAYEATTRKDYRTENLVPSA